MNTFTAANNYIIGNNPLECEFDVVQPVCPPGKLVQSFSLTCRSWKTPPVLMSFPGCSSTDEYSPCSFSSWMEVQSSILRDTSLHLKGTTAIINVMINICAGAKVWGQLVIQVPISESLSFGLQCVQLPEWMSVPSTAVTPHLYGQCSIWYKLQKLICHMNNVVLQKNNKMQLSWSITALWLETNTLNVQILASKLSF